MSIPKILSLGVVSLLALCGIAYGISEALDRTAVARTVVADPVQRILIRVDAGNVDVHAGLTDSVVVEHVDRWLLERPDVTTELRDDGTLVLESGCGNVGIVLRCETDFDIAAPSGIDIEIDGSAGDIALRGLRGRVRVRTDEGDITASRVEPVVLDARTDAGDITLDIFGSPARTNVLTAAGDVNVVVPYGSYRVDASADAGEVRVAGVIRDDLAPLRIEAGADIGDVLVQAR